MSDNPLKILVISSCAGSKKFNPKNKAHSKDLDDFIEREKKETELSNYRVQAQQMFVSKQNKRVKEGISLLSSLKNIKVDYSFISSGYGFINANEPIIPYDINFSAMNKQDLDERSEFLKIHEETFYKAKKYDLVFYLLGYDYLRSINLPLKLEEDIKQIFVISNYNEKMIPTSGNSKLITVSHDQILQLNSSPSEIKGFVFKLISEYAYHHDQEVFDKLIIKPEIIKDIIRLKIKEISNSKFEQMSMFDI